jgi:hypothetical protein
MNDEERQAQGKFVSTILNACQDSENGGHHGYLIFQFHKGNTFVEHEKLPDTNEVKTLWRT